MVVGAILNSTAFVGGSALAKYLEGKHVDEERIRHDKALEKYQQAMGDFQKKREQYQDWLNTEYVNKKQADENMSQTDQAFMLYRKAHPDLNFNPDAKPQFSHYYKASNKQKQYEMIYVGGGMLTVGYLASKFL